MTTTSETAFSTLTEAQLAARMRLALNVLLAREPSPAGLEWAARLKAGVERERIARAIARGLAERRRGL